MRSWVVALAVLATACSAASPEEARSDAGVSEDAFVEPEPATPEPDVVPSPQPVEAGVCGVGPVVSYAIGQRCGPFAVGTITCPGEPLFSGIVYGCEDDGGQPRRPNVAGCRDWMRSDGQTFTVCPEATCLPFADARCSGTAWACASNRPGVPSTSPPPSAGSCGLLGSWAVGSANGPLLCCGSVY